MKKKTYQFCVITLSMMMMLAASCGRGDDPAVSEQQTTTSVAAAETTTTAASVEEYICTKPVNRDTDDTVRFCHKWNDKVIVMAENGALFGIPYNVVTGDLYYSNLNLSELSLGDILRVKHSGEIKSGDPDSYLNVFGISKITDASDHVYEEWGGMVISVSETSLLVHPRPQEVLDPAKVDPKACYEVDIAGIPIAEEEYREAVLSPSDLKPGDFVRIECTGGIMADTMAGPRKLADVFSVIRRSCVTEQMRVIQIDHEADRLLVDDYADIPRIYFDRGDVLDLSGNAVKWEDISEGDLFEIQHGGILTEYVPAQFKRIYTVRRIKTVAQIEAEEAAKQAADVWTQRIIMRGTVKVFNGSKGVWFGETAAPDEITYFARTLLNVRNAVITDAATGQSLTWDDFRDGDYVAVETNGVIAATAPGQMDTVYSITRLSRASAEATVTAISSDGIELDMADGSVRRVAVDRFYVRGVKLDIAMLCVGDTVRLDCNAMDTEEIYALHLLDRKAEVPKGAVTGKYVVNGVSGREIMLGSGDIIIPVDLLFYDTDGSVRTANRLRAGDVIDITHNGVLTGSEPAQFGTIYKIIRVVERK